MRAVVIAGAGGPDVLNVQEVPRPEPGTGEVLVRVHAAALNRADIHQREGRYPAPPGWPRDIPGMEFAGEIAALGAGAHRWHEGDRVFGIAGGGAYAEYLVTHEDTLARVPKDMSWTDAAAVPEAFITAHDALRQAEMRAGDRVLIHAVGSGVGLAAVQLVRALGGVAYGTARHQAKLDAARALGMEQGALVGDQAADLTGAFPALAAAGGANIVLDLLGGAYTGASVALMAPRGRLILLGTLAGPRTDLPLGPVLRGRLSIRGTVLRSRALEEKIAATREFETQVVPLLENGTVKATIDKIFPLDEVRAAHARMESNAGAGKIVLRIRD
jgi:putative PIG3 family NAD(P)H quinone oxidoreductase